jgi:hypothetical protein
LKSKILLFEVAGPLVVFALLVDPFGRPIVFSFLFLGASSSSSPPDCEAPGWRKLAFCNAPALGADSAWCPLKGMKRVADATEKSLGSASFAAFARASSLILAGQIFDQAV